jgi:START domain
MKKRNYYLALTLCLFWAFPGFTQSAWVLKDEKEGIRIYSRNNQNSKFNELKVELIVKAKLTDLVAIVLDIDNHYKWSYNTISSYVLKRISNSELFFYTLINAPWPASDRDLVMHLRIKQEHHTKILTIREENVPDYLPRKKNIVRVPLSKEVWTVTPLDKKTLKIEYYLDVDPGENAPAWLVNIFATKGPYETFKNLRIQIQQPKYQLASIPFILN